MTHEKNRSGLSAPKTVLVYLAAEKLRERRPALLFTASQIEEVMQDIDAQPMPFSESYLLGLCSWRDRVLPVFDSAQLFGLRRGPAGGGVRYLLVRTVGPASKGHPLDQTIFRCVLKVTDKIITGEIPDNCTAVDAESAGIDPVSTKGVFTRAGDLIIIPELLPIISSDISVAK